MQNEEEVIFVILSDFSLLFFFCVVSCLLRCEGAVVMGLVDVLHWLSRPSVLAWSKTSLSLIFNLLVEFSRQNIMHNKSFELKKEH